MPPLRPPPRLRFNHSTATTLTNIKVESYKVLGRITSRLMFVSAAAQPPPKSPPPERRTIQSTRISTISSLVDQTKVATLAYDSQRENYGLYALKCNRTAIRNGLIIGVSPSPPPPPAAPSPPLSFAADINHEKFQPCRSQAPRRHRRWHEQNLSSLNSSNEYYKIEFNSASSTGGGGPPPPPSSPIEITPSQCRLSTVTTTTTTAKSQNFYHKETCKKNNPPPPPPPTRRKKKFAPKATSSNATSSSIDDVNISMHNQKTSPKRIKSMVNLCPLNEVINEVVFDSTGNISDELLNVSKNSSQLYRIAERKIHSVDVAVVRQCPPVKQVEFAVGTKVASSPASRRKSLAKQFSTSDDRNFDDYFEPIDLVMHDRNCDQTNCCTATTTVPKGKLQIDAAANRKLPDNVYHKFTSQNQPTPPSNNEAKLINNNSQNSSNSNISINFENKFHYANTKQKPKQTGAADNNVKKKTVNLCEVNKVFGDDDDDDATNIIITKDEDEHASLSSSSASSNVANSKRMGGTADAGTGLASGDGGGGGEEIINDSRRTRVGNNNNYGVGCNKNVKMTTTRSVYVMNFVAV